MINLNKKEISNKMEVSYTAVQYWFDGTMKPTMSRAYKLNEYFGIPLEAWKDIKSFLHEQKKLKTKILIDSRKSRKK